MQIARQDETHRVLLRLSGRFDFHCHGDFRRAYEEALETSPASLLVLDFTEVDYLDSSALGMLLLLREKADASEKQIVLSGLQGMVKQILDVANFGKLFIVQP
ncbi:MAG TPA: STAS domain-containing protein [Thiobacillaceae bacterium]|nr:STAS domain-containing protein [Thiobacillaceae bacterium]HNU64812.1 STAS domain-containing protein [Thiobacillaceae bacterium]